MTSAFASQLKAIAATSTHELDLRARRNAHAESLLFEPAVAAKQDFDTIFAICIQGFQELCYLDPQFRVFERNLFSPQAKDQDRDLMTKSENEALDGALEQCLCLLGSKLLLKPALKALEWLVRRFRVNVHNVSCLLQTLLPYHEHSLWATAISIIPNNKFVNEWKFVRPYLNNTWNVPRRVVAYTMVNNDAFFTLTNNYTLQLCRAGLEYSSQMRFWGSLFVEAVTARLSQARSGRKEILSQRTEDLLLKVLGFLSNAYAIHTSQDLLTTCHTVVILLATNADLADNVLDSLAKSIADTISNFDNDNESALITIAIICAKRNNPTVPKSLLKLSVKSPVWDRTVRSIAKSCPIQALLLAYVNTTVARLKLAHDQNLVFFLQRLLQEASSWQQANDLSKLLLPIVDATFSPTSTHSGDDGPTQALKEILQLVADDEQISNSLIEAAQSLRIDVSTLEELLLKTLSTAPDVKMIEDGSSDLVVPVVDATETFENLVEKCSSLPLDSSSFLTYPQPDCCTDLLQIYDMSLLSPTRWERFLSVPLWSANAPASGDMSTLLATFLLYVACDRKSSVLRRVFALQVLNDKSKLLSNGSFQTAFAYTLMLLSDREPSVRRASAGLLRTLSETCRTDASNLAAPYNVSDIYPGSSSSEELSPASAETISKLFDQGLSPSLEECILDASKAEDVLRGLFDGSHASELKKAARNNLFEALRSHAIYCPFLVYKVWLIRITAGVTKFGTSYKNKLLMPMLEEWVQTPGEQAVLIAEDNGMDLSQADLAMVGFFDTWDKDAVSTILGSTFVSDQATRQSLVDAVYHQLLATWNICKADVRLLLSRALWSQACSSQPTLSTNAQVVLREVSLPLEAQQEILQDALEAFDKIPQPASPSRKRKRSSAAHDVPRPRLGQEIDEMVTKLTLALEIARASEVQDKPELLGLLFDSMSALKQLKEIHRFDLPYLVQSSLTSIQAILQYIQAHKIQIDVSILKTELITDCLRSNEQPQVQEKALLVSAALANLAPERLIHSIMPVFTFMDKNIFARDDDHSVNVVNQAIDEIIPVLTYSLQKKKQPQAFLSAMASTISSLVSAIDHIPAHRRVAFYQRLLSQVGAGELGHLLMALLSQRKHNDPKFASFLTDVVSNTDAPTTLQIYCNLIDLASAVMDTSSATANAIFGFDQKTKVDERYGSLRPVLLASLAVLKPENLQRSIRRLRKLDESTSEAIKEVLDRAFRETLKTAEASKAYSMKTRTLAADCLEHLLRLPALSELFVLLPVSLEAMDEPLRAITLRVVALQVGQSSDPKVRTREMALGFLDYLKQEMSNPATSSTLLVSALKCMDQIVEKYGRKDLEAVTAAFTALMDIDLENAKTDLSMQTTSLLTMANMLEILGETAVPFVSPLVVKALNWLRSHTGSNPRPNAASANALFAVFSAVFSYAPYMVSDDQFDDLLPMLLELESDTVVDVADGVHDLLSIIARKVDLDVLLRAVTATSKSLDANSGQLQTLTGVLSETIDSASRANISKNAEAISIAFLQLLQHEAAAAPSSKEDSPLMAKLKDLCIKFIYKLSDTSFRPIFETWAEWGFGTTDATSKSTKSRQIALAHILTHFFDTLKGLVTSYVSYLLKPICAILTDTTNLFLEGKSKSVKNQPKTSDDNLELARFKTILTVLRTSLVHDAPSVSASDTSLFATPSNFPMLADSLIGILSLQSLKSIRQNNILQTDIFPTLTALATATSATPTTHQTLAQQLMQLRRHNSAHVRLASILAFKTLTADEECGEEFIANTIGISSGENEGARGSVFGELMVYVNEMLEDDDEDVEREVRKWVQGVRSRVGEDVFES